MLCAASVLAAAAAFAQRPGFNYDEAKVPSYKLPDPLAFNNGEPVRSPADWTNRRAPEVLALFAEHVYGRAPARPEELRFDCWSKTITPWDGKARRKQAAVYFTADKQEPAYGVAALPSA